MVLRNREIFGFKGSNDRVTSTKLFLNSESNIELLETTGYAALFEMHSTYDPLAKLVIPSLVLYILLSEGVQQIDDNQQGVARLITTDPYLYKQLKPSERYSRLCKRNQQPVPVDGNEEESRTMYKYHNFTSGKE